MGRSNTLKMDDKDLQDSILSMLEWIADRDPVRAASLINAYLDEVADEISGGQPKSANG